MIHHHRIFEFSVQTEATSTSIIGQHQKVVFILSSRFLLVNPPIVEEPMPKKGFRIVDWIIGYSVLRVFLLAADWLFSSIIQSVIFIPFLEVLSAIPSYFTFTSSFLVCQMTLFSLCSFNSLFKDSIVDLCRLISPFFSFSISKSSFILLFARSTSKFFISSISQKLLAIFYGGVHIISISCLQFTISCEFSCSRPLNRLICSNYRSYLRNLSFYFCSFSIDCTHQSSYALAVLQASFNLRFSRISLSPSSLCLYISSLRTAAVLSLDLTSLSSEATFCFIFSPSSATFFSSFISASI